MFAAAVSYAKRCTFSVKSKVIKKKKKKIEVISFPCPDGKYGTHNNWFVLGAVMIIDNPLSISVPVKLESNLES